MPNTIYPKANEQLLQGGINLSTADVKAVAVDTGAYTYSAAHQFLSDIPVGARIATSPNLASKTLTNGTFDSADIVFAAFSGATVEAIVLYIDTGVASTSRLLAMIDTNAGLPFTPNGSNLTLGTPNGWFTVGSTANILYQKAAQAALGAGFNLLTADVRVVLLNTALYTVAPGTHEFLSDIPAGARVGTTGLLTGKTATDGVFDSADLTINAVTGAAVGALAGYIDTAGADTGKRLIWYSGSNPGLPYTPNGGNLNIGVPSGWLQLSATVS